MQIKNVISSGCSFAHGAELLEKNNRFSKLVSNHYNANLIDYSRGGFGNETISYKLIDGILNQIKNNLINPKKTLVLINLTYGTRFAFYNKEVNGWFSLLPSRVDKKKLHKRLQSELLAEIDFRKKIETLNFNVDSELASLLFSIKKLIHEHYVESDKPDETIPELLHQKINALSIKINNLQDCSSKEIAELKYKIEDYLSYALFDSALSGDKYFSKYIHFSDVNYYFDNHSDIRYLIYDLASTIHKTQTFLKCYGFDKYVFTFVCKNTKQLIETGKNNYNELYSNCYDREGFGHFKNILYDIDCSKIFNVPFEEFALKNNYKIGNGGHPLEDAHNGYSNLLINFIGDLYDKKNN